MQLSALTLPLAHALRRANEFVPIRGWERVLRMAFEPAKQKPFRFEVPLFEATLVGNPENYIDWYTLLHGCYEREDVLVMRNLLSQISDAIVLDIGANVGQHSLALAALAARVHAFEPYPPRLDSLRANTARNPQLPISIHPIALGDRDGAAPFLHTVDGHWAGVQYDPEGSLRFSMRHADTYLNEQRIEQVHLIKLDVDGNELEILRGLRNTLDRDRPIILVEANEGIREFHGDLPEQYHFLHHIPLGGLIAGKRLCDVDEQSKGNVFCIPREKLSLLRFPDTEMSANPGKFTEPKRSGER
jgi:FkbM family methyltransferase